MSDPGNLQGPLAKIEASLKNSDRSTDSSQTTTNVLNNANIRQGDNSSIAVTVSTLGRKFRSQPWWIQVGAFAIFLIVLMVLYSLVDTYFIKRNNFISAVSSGIAKNRSQFMSSVNVMMTTLPQNIIPENGPRQWSAVSRLWVRAGNTFEEAYDAGAKCLTAGTCIAGGAAEDLCRQALQLAMAYESNLNQLRQIDGITINMAPGNAMAPFGENVVDVLPLTNLPTVAKHCKDRGIV